MERDLDPVELRLIQWAEFMRKNEPTAEGYPTKASGSFIVSWCKDSEEVADAHEANQATLIDACIHSLSMPHRIVIYKRHGIGYQTWRFPDEGVIFEAAKQAIAPLLRKRCLI